MPDGTEIDPPTTPPPAQSPTSEYEFDLAANDLWQVATDGTQVSYIGQGADGSVWFTTVNAADGTYHATYLNAPDGYDPFAGLQLQTGFTPSTDKPTFVWDPNSNTLFAQTPGVALPPGATGGATGDANYVLLQKLPPVTLPGAPPTAPPPPATIPDSPPAAPTPPATLPGTTPPAQTPGSPVSIMKLPNGVTVIEFPGGKTITSFPVDPNDPSKGTSYVIEQPGKPTITIGAPGTTVKVKPGTTPSDPPVKANPPGNQNGPLPPVPPGLLRPTDPNVAPPPGLTPIRPFPTTPQPATPEPFDPTMPVQPTQPTTPPPSDPKK